MVARGAKRVCTTAIAHEGGGLLVLTFWNNEEVPHVRSAPITNDRRH